MIFSRMQWYSRKVMGLNAAYVELACSLCVWVVWLSPTLQRHEWV